MKCSFCGTENVQGRTHCIACGTPLEQTPISSDSSDLIEQVPPQTIIPPVVEPPVSASTPVSYEPVASPVVESPVHINHVAISEPERMVVAEAESTITYPASIPEQTSQVVQQDQPIDIVPHTPVSATSKSASVDLETTSNDAYVDYPAAPVSLPPLPYIPESQELTVTPINHELQAPVQAVPSVPNIPDTPIASAPVFHEDAVVSSPLAPSYLDDDKISNIDVPKNQVPGRVDVQFNDAEVEEVPMTVQNEASHQSPVLSSNNNLDTEHIGAGEADDNSSKTGPWLALTVLVAIGILIIGVIYFVYRLIFATPQQGSVITQPLPTSTIVSTPSTIPTTPAAVPVSAHDQQREKDVADLKVAMANYFSDNVKYPNAASYNSLLNTLISAHYLTRRIQDPLFPTQQYQYSASPDQSSYTITVQFEGLGSSLLNGSTTYQFGS